MTTVLCNFRMDKEIEDYLQSYKKNVDLNLSAAVRQIIKEHREQIGIK